jgi:polysaccharide export outer membrane protein
MYQQIMGVIHRLHKFVLACGIALIALSTFFCSCTNTRQLVYFQGIDTARINRTVPRQQQIIRKGDLLSIIVYSDNPEATKIYNQTLITAPSSNIAGSAEISSALSGNSPSTSGYQVDERGNIEFQGLGLLHVDSLTKDQLRDTLTEKLKNFLVNPYFTIRTLNYKFTMLGEVSHPGTFSIPNDRISLLEALAQAGDLTFYGRRDSILVIRENGGIREIGRLDIRKPQSINSPYFYLQPDDVVIVEPTKKKIAANDQTLIRNVTIASSIISTLALLYTIFK